MAPVAVYLQARINIADLIALLVTLIPTTIGALLSAIGIAGIEPEEKLKLIRREQAQGRLVAMTGDGTNDAPALAQADVGVDAMHSGTNAAKEAANLIDLNSDPTKLIDLVAIGKQMLMRMRCCRRQDHTAPARGVLPRSATSKRRASMLLSAGCASGENFGRAVLV